MIGGPIVGFLVRVAAADGRRAGPRRARGGRGGRAGPAGARRPRRRAPGARAGPASRAPSSAVRRAELGRLAGEQEIALRTLIRRAGRRRLPPGPTTRWSTSPPRWPRWAPGRGVSVATPGRAGRGCRGRSRRAGRRGGRVPRQRGTGTSGADAPSWVLLEDVPATGSRCRCATRVRASRRAGCGEARGRGPAGGRRVDPGPDRASWAGRRRSPPARAAPSGSWWPRWSPAGGRPGRDHPPRAPVLRPRAGPRSARLRGRLGGAVTLWTAGPAATRAGLTVSSLMVANGEPGRVLALLDPDSDLHRGACARPGAAVVCSCCAWRDRDLAEAFAGHGAGARRAVPAGDVRATPPWGPRLADAPRRGRGCRAGVGRRRSAGRCLVTCRRWSTSSVGDDGRTPLVHRRGRYLRRAGTASDPA